jgi:hypothetical protein
MLPNQFDNHTLIAYKSPHGVIEAGFTRHLSKYLDDHQYRTLQAELATNPELGDSMPGTGGFERCAGRMPGGARGEEVGCGLSITTSSPIARYG